MSSSRRQRMPRANNRVLLAAAAIGTLIASLPASAQMPVQPQARGPVFAPGAQPEEPITLPQGASISDAQNRVQSLAAEAGKALDGLVGNAVTDREKAQIEALSERKRRILVLEDQLKEAKLAKQIWKELHGDEDKDNEQVKKLEEEKRMLIEQLKMLESSASTSKPEPEPMPVVSSISGAAGAAKAVILVPFVGTVHAQVGTLLPNGMKVASVSRGGVVVEKDGTKVGLAFGSSVPLVRPKAPDTMRRTEPGGLQMMQR